MTRSLLCTLAVPLVCVGFAAGQTTTTTTTTTTAHPRVLVVPTNDPPFTGQLLKPDPLEFQFLRCTQGSDVAVLSDGQIPLSSLIAITLSGSARVPNANETISQYLKAGGVDTIVTPIGPPFVFLGVVPGSAASTSPSGVSLPVPPTLPMPTPMPGAASGSGGQASPPPKFVIQPDPGCPCPQQAAGLAVSYAASKLRAIYFLSPPPVPGNTKGATGAAPRDSGTPDSGAPILDRLNALKQERDCLLEDYKDTKGLCEGLTRGFAQAWERSNPIVSVAEAHAKAAERMRVLDQAYHLRDVEISQLETALAFMPLVSGGPTNSASTDGRVPGDSVLAARRNLDPFAAFAELPKVTRIRDAGAAEDEVEVAPAKYATPGPLLQLPCMLNPQRPFDMFFDRPASFPIVRFGQCGEPLATEGVVIYEGMHFRAQKDGHYRLSFTTSVPAMPVTLRLQMVFQGPRCVVPLTLTLPPIKIAPKKLDFTGNDPGESYQVYHSGFSPMLAEHFGDLPYETLNDRAGLCS